MSWLARLWAAVGGEPPEVLRAQRDMARADVRELRNELRVARAYIGELDQARLRYIAALERVEAVSQTAKEALKAMRAPVKPEAPRKIVGVPS